MNTVRNETYEYIAARVRRFPFMPIASLRLADGSAEDRAFANALASEVLRRWLTLQTVIGYRLDRPWEAVSPQAAAALLVGSAELLLLERRADHAAVYEAVEWISKRLRPGAGKFVNALLRAVARLRGERTDSANLSLPWDGDRRTLPLADGGALQLVEEVFADDPTLRLAQQTSHSPVLVQRWHGSYDPVKAGRLAMHSLIKPPLILAADIDRSQIAPDLRDFLAPHDEPGYWVWTGDHATLVSALRENPRWRVQDSTAARAVVLAADLTPNVIADVCAGRGTKTRQIRETFPKAEVVATDPDDDRRDDLRTAIDHVAGVLVIEPDERISYAGKVDLLVLDVPCSNTGVLARRLEAKYRFSDRELDKLVNLQRQIVADHLALLADNGYLLYTTCSVEPEENLYQVDWICRWHRMTVVKKEMRLPEGLPGDPPSSYRDGGFAALLKRE